MCTRFVQVPVIFSVIGQLLLLLLLLPYPGTTQVIHSFAIQFLHNYLAMGGACASTSDNNVRMCLRAAVNDAAVPVLRRVVKSVFTVALMAASVSRCALMSVEELELGPLFKRLDVRCCCRFFFRMEMAEFCRC